MKTEEGLYIKILVWIYERQEKGFKWEELVKEFNLDPLQIQWVLQIFRSNVPITDNLISHIEGKDSYTYFITDKGVSAAVDYLNLKEARVSSERAERLAKWAIGIGVVVGLVQIVIGVLQLCK